jgi:uncharacterized protein YbbC (DUF1343 family)
VSFIPVDFTPWSSPFKNQQCHGIQILLHDRQALDPPALGIELASALNQLFPKEFHLDKNLWLIGSREVLKAIREGQDPKAIIANWQGTLEKFLTLRSKYLLY